MFKLRIAVPKKHILLPGILLSFLTLCMGQPVVLANSGIGGRPAWPDPANERSKSIFIKQINPLAKSEDAIEVVNSSSVKKEVLVYAVDAVSSSGGAFACAQAADIPRGVGSWTMVSARSVVLGAGQKQIVPFTIAVPQNASVGEHNGCIVLQEKKEATIQGGIGISFRTAVRVAVLVPGDIIKEITPEGLSVAKKEQNIIVSPRVKNTGNVSIDTKVQAQISSIFGSSVKIQENTFPVLKGQMAEWNFELQKPFWGGFYKVGYRLAYDPSPEHFIGSSTQNERTVGGQSRWLFVAPDPFAIVIEASVAMALFSLCFVAVRRMLNRRHVLRNWTTHAVKDGEHIQDIAKRYAIGWRKLAKANKLAPPYRLKAGDLVRVPKTGQDGKNVTVKHDRPKA